MASPLKVTRLGLTEPTKCANCGILVSMRCAGCQDSPQYESGEPVGILYCGRECQTTHWPTHKAKCIVMRNRKKLLRTATLLKATLLAYRECAFDVDIKRIEFQAGCLRLQGSNRNGHTHFPNHLTTNIEYREAALTNNQCTLAMALLGPLARQLLAEISFGITLSEISLGKPVFHTKLFSGPGNPPNYIPPHTVLVVELNNNKEKWIIDTAGAQFGFQDVATPVHKYFEEKECEDMNRSEPYDSYETKDVDYFFTLPFMTATAQQRKQLKEERAARLHFAAFVKTHIQEGGASLKKDMLSGSTSDFYAKLDIFIRDLKVHMTEFVDRKNKAKIKG